jgi:hypothetical protein
MKQYSLTAQIGRGPPRTCAILPAATYEDARRSAQSLIESGRLSFVEYGSKYEVRPATRRETSLMQSFMASKSRARTDLHVGADFDGLLARRQDLITSFFLSLYIDPDGSRGTRSEPPASRPSTPAGTTGSGGVETDPTEASTQEAEEVEAEAPESPQEQEAEGAIDSSSQEDALAAILNSGEANDPGEDTSVDLGDDFY